MKATTIPATDLKNKTADVLNQVSFGGLTITVERHGKPIAHILPVSNTESKKVKKTLNKYFGSIQDIRLPKDRSLVKRKTPTF